MVIFVVVVVVVIKWFFGKSKNIMQKSVGCCSDFWGIMVDLKMFPIIMLNGQKNRGKIEEESRLFSLI